MRKYLYILPLFMFSCSGEQSDQENTVHSQGISVDTIATDTTDVSTSEPELPFIDPEREYKANILMETEYHDDEVMDNVNELEWWGLFADPDGHCSLKIADVEGTRVMDGIVDREHQKTGWKITAADERSCVILINGLDFLKEGNVYTWINDNKTIMPEEEITEVLGDREHRIFATGTIENDGHQDLIMDYKLHYEVSENGEIKSSTIDEMSYGYDSGAMILFIGDIDMDGYFDIITNNTNHYNAFVPTLYLSRLADKGKLWKKVASHRSVGC